MIQDREL